METNRCRIWVYLKKSKPSKDGKALLLMRLTVNGRRWDSTLKVRIHPSAWDPIKEKATGDRYSDMLKILKNHDHEEYESFIEWLGGRFNTEHFNLNKVNKLLRTKDFGCVELDD